MHAHQPNAVCNCPRTHLKAPTSVGPTASPSGTTPRHVSVDTRMKGTPLRSATVICSRRERRIMVGSHDVQRAVGSTKLQVHSAPRRLRGYAVHCLCTAGEFKLQGALTLLFPAFQRSCQRLRASGPCSPSPRHTQPPLAPPCQALERLVCPPLPPAVTTFHASPPHRLHAHNVQALAGAADGDVHHRLLVGGGVPASWVCSQWHIRVCLCSFPEVSTTGSWVRGRVPAAGYGRQCKLVARCAPGTVWGAREEATCNCSLIALIRNIYTHSQLFSHWLSRPAATA